MLMLQPPGCGSSYVYVLPQVEARKPGIGPRALIRRMRVPRVPVRTAGRTGSRGTLRTATGVTQRTIVSLWTCRVRYRAAVR
ncbi:hypothetical protein GCM10018773_16040 [Streptomyces candidus]|nr:hypothetical protein GCM10018773_16040 [Streptomyces candidus]